MTYENFSNAPQTILNAIALIGDTSITVLGNAGFPTSGQFRILVESEIMLVTAGSTGLTWTVSRAQEGSLAAQHASGITVTHVLTTGGLMSGFEQRGTQSIAYAAVITPDASLGTVFLIGTLTANITINAPVNGKAGQRIIFFFTQDGTGGRTVAWDVTFITLWQPSSPLNAISSIGFIYDGTHWQQYGASLVDNLGNSPSIHVATGPIVGNMSTDVFSGAITITVDSTRGNFHTIAATSNTASTLTPSGPGTAGQPLWILITADGTGGNVITFASTFKSNGTLTTTASKGHTIHFMSDGVNWWEITRTLAL